MGRPRKITPYKWGDKWVIESKDGLYTLYKNGVVVVITSTSELTRVVRGCMVKNSMRRIKLLDYENTRKLSNCYLHFVDNLGNDKVDISARIKQLETKDFEIKKCIEVLRKVLVFY